MYELAGLYELDSTLDENDWPCLELHNATVWHKDALVDLMDVSEHGPFIVKGMIHKSDPGIQPGMVKNPNVFKTPLLIRKVYSYSIETTETGNYKIWALGKAAWYHIKPAPEYKEFYQAVMKKARLWTFTEEKYMDALDELLETPAAKKKNIRLTPTFDQLCNEYATFDSKHCRFPFSAKKWYKDDFRRFMIMRMLENQLLTDRDWTRTPIFEFYTQHYPETVTELKDVLKRQKRLRSGDTAMEADVSPAPTTQEHSKGSTENQMKKEPLDEYGDTISVQLRPLRSRRRPRSSTSTTATPEPRKRNKNSQVNSSPIYSSPASRIKTLTRSAKRAKTSTHGAPTTTCTPAFTIPEAAPAINSTISIPKLRKLKRKWDFEDDSEDDSDVDETPPSSSAPASKGKSTLRPSGVFPREPSPLIKRSRSLSPIPTSQERLQRLKLQFEKQELKLVAQQEYEALLDRKTKMGVLDAYELPNAEPDDNGYWKCQYAGGSCYFKIDNATDLNGLQTIEDHVNSHFRDMRRILGVIGDESIGGLPKISHLISKVESLAESLTPQKSAPPEHPIWDFCR